MSNKCQPNNSSQNCSKSTACFCSGCPWQPKKVESKSEPSVWSQLWTLFMQNKIKLGSAAIAVTATISMTLHFSITIVQKSEKPAIITKTKVKVIRVTDKIYLPFRLKEEKAKLYFSEKLRIMYINTLISPGISTDKKKAVLRLLMNDSDYSKMFACKTKSRRRYKRVKKRSKKKRERKCPETKRPNLILVAKRCR